MSLKKALLFAFQLTLILSLAMMWASPAKAAPVSGAIFTTNSTCSGVNINIYGDKGDVYLDGGPAHPGAAGLPDGYYYVQITDPSGAVVLGTSVNSGNDTPIQVVNGEFANCYQLWSILIQPDGTQGYASTPNNGGEYKVWVSTDATFTNSETKTDNFKVNEGVTPPPQATLNVLKFYDANANGIDDDGQYITGWKVRIQDNIDYIRDTPVTITVAPDDYTVTEFMPIETNWMSTTANPVYVTLANGDNATVEFGNLCVGAGGGLTLGFWSNQNGKALIGTDDLFMLTTLNLRNASGANFDPAAYAGFRTWLLSATATNMSYMLSAQLAAMELNVYNGKVNGGALIYAPGTTSANTLGFATVNAVMAEANTELGLHGLVLDGSPYRAYQESLKNALDKANNNYTFVQASPCPFTFAP